MRNLLIFGVILACGCQQQPPVPVQPNHKLEIEVRPAPTIPVPPPTAPVAPGPEPLVPPVVSRTFMIGYWDGYFSRYASWRWAYMDYRDGWHLGQYDRLHGIRRFR